MKYLTRRTVYGAIEDVLNAFAPKGYVLVTVVPAGTKGTVPGLGGNHSEPEFIVVMEKADGLEVPE